MLTGYMARIKAPTCEIQDTEWGKTGNIIPYSFQQVRGFFNIPC